MNNILFIQHEKLKESSYIFLDEKLLSKQDTHSIDLKEKFSTGMLNIKLKRVADPKTTIKKNVLSNYVITGCLNELDEIGRIMMFTCAFSGSENDFEKHIHNCLNQINKTINPISLQEIKKAIKHFRAKKITLFTITIAITIYALLK